MVYPYISPNRHFVVEASASSRLSDQGPTRCLSRQRHSQPGLQPELSVGSRELSPNSYPLTSLRPEPPPPTHTHTCVAGSHLVVDPINLESFIAQAHHVLSLLTSLFLFSFMYVVVLPAWMCATSVQCL